MANLFPKRCKVYPRNNMQYISGILEKQKRIELPAELPLSEKELRRCLSYGNCFEMVGGKHVLLTLENFSKDNKDGKDVTSMLPKGEVSKPRDTETVEEEPVSPPPHTEKQSPSSPQVDQKTQKLQAVQESNSQPKTQKAESKQQHK